MLKIIEIALIAMATVIFGPVLFIFVLSALALVFRLAVALLVGIIGLALKGLSRLERLI